jgi:hypothetical protein
MTFGQPSNDFELAPNQDLVLQDGDRANRLRLDSDGAIWLYSRQREVKVRLGTVDDDSLPEGGQAGLLVGGGGQAGEILILDVNGDITIHLNGETGNLSLGRTGNPGELFVKDANNDITIHLNGGTGNLSLGHSGRAGDLFVKNADGDNTIRLNGGAGDIELLAADCAEEFAVCDGEAIEPGTLMVIEDGEQLRPSSKAYDSRVAGVISGAQNCEPAIVLNRRRNQSGRSPLALVGRIYCKVDANYGPVGVGDLLTSSDTPGHAMRASEPMRAFGAVVGKAMKSLPSGRSLIPILMGLQ